MAMELNHPQWQISTKISSWEVKAAGAYGLQPHNFHVLIVLKSGSLDLWERSGPVQECNGIALPCFALSISPFSFCDIATAVAEIIVKNC
jgi:hypothetical protein